MTEADILAQTYWDTCTIKRKNKLKKDNIISFELQDIYIDIPCGFGSGGLGDNIADNNVHTNLFKLHTRPNVDIQIGDIVYINNLHHEVVETFKYYSHRITMIKEVNRL